jgi:hypothetical protein
MALSNCTGRTWHQPLRMLTSMYRQSRFKRPSKTRARSRERSRQIAVLAVMAGVLVAGLLVAGKFEVWQTLFGRSAAQLAAARSDDEIYTGTILYEPPQGALCRELLFDNRTGRVQDNGLVDCEQAYYRGSGKAVGQSAAPRAVAISESFRHR